MCYLIFKTVTHCFFCKQYKIVKCFKLTPFSCFGFLIYTIFDIFQSLLPQDGFGRYKGNRPLSRKFCTSNRLDVQKQSFLFSWDSKWPPCDKGLIQRQRLEKWFNYPVNTFVYKEAKKGFYGSEVTSPQIQSASRGR